MILRKSMIPDSLQKHEMKTTIIFGLIAIAASTGFSQVATGDDDFTSRVGLAAAGGTGRAYGAKIEGAPWQSDISVGAFVDWQTKYIGFKTSAFWTTYEGGSFDDGTLSLEFLPKCQWPSTGLFGGIGAFTLMNAPGVSKSGFGLVAEAGWQRGQIIVSARIRHSLADLSDEISGGQHSFNLGAGLYYAFIRN